MCPCLAAFRSNWQNCQLLVRDRRRRMKLKVEALISPPPARPREVAHLVPAKIQKEFAVTQEQVRLQEARKGISNWRKWGPYLSERQWGTVREDYSEDGNAW